MTYPGSYSLFDPPEPEPAYVPTGALPRVAHFYEQVKLGRLDALEGLKRAAAEVAAHLEQLRRTAAARDAQVTENREGKLRANASATSARAARNIIPKMGSQRGRVLSYIASNNGATDHQISRALGILDSSVRPRRGELLEDGYVIDTGRVREHRGSEWTVWMPTDLGMDWYLRAEQQVEAA